MKKNLALFIPTLLRGGGAEATVSKIASLLKDHYQISIITLESGCDFNLDPSIKIFSLSKTHGSKTDYLKLFSFFSQISRLKKIINNNNIDIILSFTERPNLILSFVKKIKIPKVYCFRNYYSHHINDKTLWGLNWLRKLTFKWLAKRLRKSNDQIVTISKKAKEDLVDNFGFDPRKVEVIYNFYDLDLNSNKSLKEDPSYQNILKEDFLLSVGRLCHQKGQWILIKVLPFLLKIKPNLKLVILGSGVYLQNLKKLCQDLNLTYSTNPNDQVQVYFLGVISNPFVFYKKTKAFCLSSLWEGFPNVLVEAMSVKAPVIANDCLSGPREILFNKADLDQNIDKYQIADYGIIVPLKNTKEPDWINYPLTTDGENWLQALKKILEDEELQNELKEKSSQRAKDFSLDRGRENWMRLVEKVSK